MPRNGTYAGNECVERVVIRKPGESTRVGPCPVEWSTVVPVGATGVECECAPSAGFPLLRSAWPQHQRPTPNRRDTPMSTTFTTTVTRMVSAAKAGWAVEVIRPAVASASIPRNAVARRGRPGRLPPPPPSGATTTARKPRTRLMATETPWTRPGPTALATGATHASKRNVRR